MSPSRFTLWTRYRLQFLPYHFQASNVSYGWWEEEPYWFGVTGSKVKVNFGTLCIRLCGHNTDYSFSQSLSNFTCKLSRMRAGTLLISGYGVKGQCQLWHSLHKTVWTRYRLNFMPYHFQTSPQLLSNFTCKLWMIRGGTLLIWGHGVKGQSQLWRSLYKTLWTRYRLHFMPYHFQTSHVSYWWWEEEPYWFGVTRSKVKVNFGTLCIGPCGHNTDYSFCPINFKLHMWVVDGERRNPIDLESKVKVYFGTLCIRPCGHDTDYSIFPITLIFKLHM